MSMTGKVYPGDLFVFYGLLKQGAAGAPSEIDLEKHGVFKGACALRGRMLDVGGYPGVVEGQNLVQGQRYQIDDVTIVPALDAFEGVTNDRKTSLYLRKKVALFTSAGVETNRTAWVYWYNQADKGFPIIMDGDWPLDRGKARN